MKNLRVLVSILACLALCFFIFGCGNATGGGGGGGGSSGASLLYVSNSGSDETGDGSAAKPYEHIQKGLDKIAANGMVSVEMGYYIENLTWPSKEGITLYSPGTSAFTILDGGAVGRCIDIPWATSIKAAGIIGMKIQNGHKVSYGGAGINMECPDTTLYLYDVFIDGCTIEAASAAYGCGINVSDSTSTLEAVHCWIKNNTEYHTGSAPSKPSAAGLFCNGTLYLSSCEVSNNTAPGGQGGIFAIYGRIENCLIHHNNGGSEKGGGIALYGEAPGVQIINCTIASNETTAEGGAVYSHKCADKLINCILWGDVATGGSNEVYWNPSYVSAMTGTVEYCDVQGGSAVGVHNIAAPGDDPKFKDADNDDFQLQDASPSSVQMGGTTMEGTPSCDYLGHHRPDSHHSNGNCSMGAYEFIPSL